MRKAKLHTIKKAAHVIFGQVLIIKHVTIRRMDNLVGFRWLGVGGVELSAGGQVLAIDPFFTRPPFSAMWGKRVSPNRSLVVAQLPRPELEKLFDYGYYTRYVDDIFVRLGLAGNQWQAQFEQGGPSPIVSRKL